MEQNTSWDGNSFSAGQEILCLLCHWRFITIFTRLPLYPKPCTPETCVTWNASSYGKKLLDTAQPASWRTTWCWPSLTAYSIYINCPSIYVNCLFQSWLQCYTDSFKLHLSFPSSLSLSILSVSEICICILYISLSWQYGECT